jgi:hypothetical protein
MFFLSVAVEPTPLYLDLTKGKAHGKKCWRSADRRQRVPVNIPIKVAHYDYVAP